MILAAGYGGMAPDAGKGLMLNVLRIPSNCRNFNAHTLINKLLIY